MTVTAYAATEILRPARNAVRNIGLIVRNRGKRYRTSYDLL